MANRTNQIEKEITEKIEKIENKDIKLLAEIQRLYVESVERSLSNLQNLIFDNL